jgi:hypothetical protein
VDLYIHSPIRLHGEVLNELSIGTNLPLPSTVFEDVGLRKFSQLFHMCVLCRVYVVLILNSVCLSLRLGYVLYVRL